MRFHDPLLLVFLIAVPVLLYLSSREKRKSPAIRFSSISPVLSMKASLRLRLAKAPLFLRIAAVVLLILALARP
jgi:Ca-activated chloride channel family protein